MASLDQLSAARERLAEAVNATTDRNMRELQRKLADMLNDEILSKFTIKNGQFVDNAGNFYKLSDIERMFENFEQAYVRPALKDYATRVLDMTAQSASYYKGVGFSGKAVNNALESMKQIEARLGIRNGEIIADSFLDRLAGMSEIKQQVTEYVMTGVNAGVSVKDFTKGLRTLVDGASGVDGSLVKYMKTYTHDLTFSIDRAADKYMAKNLGLTHYRFTGTIIKNSRQFCRDHVGKTYTEEEVKKWKDMVNDPDGPQMGAAEALTYDPFTDLGGHNCRHVLRPISKKLYDKYNEETAE